jgi:membrane protease YdiL (CAAX protease family)
MSTGGSAGRDPLVGGEITGRENSPQALRARAYPAVASPAHTIVAMILLAAWAYLGVILIRWMETAANPHRLRIYFLSMAVEWLLLAYVAAGLRHNSGSLRVVLGEDWFSRGQLLRDSGIAAGFWLVSALVLVSVRLLLRLDVQGVGVRSLFPQSNAEVAVWIVLSVTAGVCEEAIFRGYLQRQFMAFTKSAPAGILLSAVAFAAGHAYQGNARMILIALYGAMFGMLAHWRRSLRPGMIAHAWQDSLSGLLAAILGR